MGQRAEYDSADYEQRVNTDPDTLHVLKHDTSRKFHDLMDAAMLVSHHKYGWVAEGYPERVNAIESMRRRFDMYRKTGNTEYLVDVANFAMIEFMHPAHPKAHYQATDASGSPGRVAQNTAVYDRANQFKNTDLEPTGTDG